VSCAGLFDEPASNDNDDFNNLIPANLKIGTGLILF
jgi:hypothetical protein